MKKEYCQGCECLVKGENGEWICGETGTEICDVRRCCQTDYTPSSTRGDYGPSNPWDAPGCSIDMFISGVIR